MLDEGKNILGLTLSVKDSVGNSVTKEYSNYLITKDTTAPEVDVSVQNEYDGAYIVNVNIKDDYPSIGDSESGEINLDITVNGSYVSSYKIYNDNMVYLDEGENEVTITGSVYDYAGNETPVNYTEIITYNPDNY